jgi:hypothetical protein
VPALPDVPNVLRVDFHFDVGSDTHVSAAWHIKYTGGPPTTGDANAIATAINTAGVTAFPPLMHPTRSFEGVTVTDLTSPTSAQGVHLASTIGTRSGVELAAEVCALVNLGISRRYRGGKPRNYWPFGIGADLADPQTWQTSFQTLVAGNLETLLGSILAISVGTTVLVSLGSVSYFSGFHNVTGSTGRMRAASTVRTGAIPFDVANSITLNPKPGSQRRRQLHSR